MERTCHLWESVADKSVKMVGKQRGCGLLPLARRQKEDSPQLREPPFPFNLLCVTPRGTPSSHIEVEEAKVAFCRGDFRLAQFITCSRPLKCLNFLKVLSYPEKKST